MIVLELHRVEIDYCTQCGGIWLDAGELGILMGDSKEAKRIMDSLEVPRKSTEKRMRCPVCRKKMDKVYAATEEQIVIDKCKKDHGLWFDEGELHRLIEKGVGPDNKVLHLLEEIFHYKLK